MIYLDHAAATPVSQHALEAMLPYFSDNFYNPSAPYLPAKHVRGAYATAKDTIAHAIGAKGTDLVITAGATEANNLAFTVLNCKSNPLSTSHSTTQAERSATPTGNVAPHSSRIHSIEPGAPLSALVLSTEHVAVLATARNFPHQEIAVDRTGLIDLSDLRQKLTDDVALISISLANNELGTIQPLAEIADLVRRTRQDRLSRGLTTPLYLHSDASQAANLLDINVSRLGVDLLTLNAAKCGGPKGVGALYIAHGVPVQPLSFGGGQERGLRSGTENVPGVIGCAAAISDAKSHLSSNRKKYADMIKSLRQGLNAALSSAQIPSSHNFTTSAPTHSSPNPAPSPKITPLYLGHPKHQLANFLPISFPGLDAERLIYKLEQQGILLSTGAACAASKGEKSHVLSAIGLSDEEIAGSLRISLGPTNTPDQIPVIVDALSSAVISEYTRTSASSPSSPHTSAPSTSVPYDPSTSAPHTPLASEPPHHA